VQHEACKSGCLNNVENRQLLGKKNVSENKSLLKMLMHLQMTKTIINNKIPIKLHNKPCVKIFKIQLLLYIAIHVDTSLTRIFLGRV
jgi:hypothetical protein